MLQLKPSKTSGFELTDRKQVLTLRDQAVLLNDQEVSTPGEYEAGGIEVVYGNQAALVVWERLQMVFVFGTGKPTPFDRSQFSSADVMVLSNNLSELSKENMTDLFDAYDPKVVILGAPNKIDESLKTALKVQETNIAKLSEQALPTEGRDVYLIV